MLPHYLPIGDMRFYCFRITDSGLFEKLPCMYSMILFWFLVILLKYPSIFSAPITNNGRDRIPIRDLMRHQYVSEIFENNFTSGCGIREIRTLSRYHFHTRGAISSIGEDPPELRTITNVNPCLLAAQRQHKELVEFFFDSPVLLTRMNHQCQHVRLLRNQVMTFLLRRSENGNAFL